MQLTSAAQDPQIQLSRNVLNLPYFLIPATVAVVSADILFFNSHLRKVLPDSFNSVPTLRFFLSHPHIIGSTLSLLDRSYLSFYQKYLLFPVPIIFLFVIVIGPGQYAFILAILMEITTATHFTLQQFNMANLLTGITNARLTLWRWNGILLSLFIHALLGLTKFRWLLDNYFHPQWLLEPLAIGSFITFSVLTYRVFSDIRIKSGRTYTIGNLGMGASVLFFYFSGYPFFITFITQCIHDFTAYAFYMTHDQNRNDKIRYNFFYKALEVLPIKVFWLCPIFTITIAYSMQSLSLKYSVLTSIATTLVFIHYYTESFIWRRPFLHRQYVRLK